MKPDLNYYSLEDLVERWKEYNIKENDLLKYGQDGKLQFSMWVTPPSDNYSYVKITCGYYEWLEDEETNPIARREYPIYFGSRELFMLSHGTIDKLLNTALKGTAHPRLNPICGDCPKKCENLNHGRSAGLYVSYSGSLDREYADLNNMDTDVYAHEHDFLAITKDDLVVRHSDLVQFEKYHFKPEEVLPPYLDPDNEFYSVTLDLAVRAWKALFEEKKHLLEASAGKAGAAYLQRPESGCTELLYESGIKLTPTLAENIAKVAAGEYSPYRQKWNTFCKLNK